jgi:FtsH-binding integral membrane protein
VPDQLSPDKQVSLEEQQRQILAQQKVGNLLSLGLLGFAVFQWWTRPAPLQIYVVDDMPRDLEV